MSSHDGDELKKVTDEIASFGHQVKSGRGASGYGIFKGNTCVAGCPGYTLTLADLKAWVKEQKRLG